MVTVLRKISKLNKVNLILMDELLAPKSVSNVDQTCAIPEFIIVTYKLSIFRAK